jgi:sugar (pentulose or hexulose) kinase
MVQIKERFDPNPANHSRYDEAFSTYVQLYDSLCPLFERSSL